MHLYLIRLDRISYFQFYRVLRRYVGWLPTASGVIWLCVSVNKVKSYEETIKHSH